MKIDTENVVPLKIKLVSNIDELHLLIENASTKIKELQQAIDDFNNFELKVGVDEINDN